MTTRNSLLFRIVIAASLLTAGRLAAQQAPAKPEHGHHEDSEQSPQLENDAVKSMTPGHAHHGVHIKLTEPRPQTPQDLARAEALVQTLQKSLENYKDYRVAIADGFRPFLPQLSLPEHHFTNYWLGFEAAFRFDPAQPTSLLYKKVAGGWELVGAMYTAPRTASEDQLNQRVPLSVARWHAHVNICLPQRGQGTTTDWTKFGPAGSITTPEACSEAGGRFVPQLFGWMVHVYPWEKSLEKVWRH